MDRNKHHRYEILKQLALAGSRGEELRPTVELALGEVTELLGLQAASMYLWGEDMSVKLAVGHAATEAAQAQLTVVEEELFRQWRRDKHLLSAYMTFGGPEPSQSFTLPLRHASEVFGAMVGIQLGDGKLVSEDLFLEAITAAIALNVIASGAGQGQADNRELIDKERLTAIIQMAVTVNHEINNPLTAILGNIQLLLLNRKNLDEDLAHKLHTMEASAMKIKDITQRLLRVSSARTVQYSEGTDMLDLSDTDEDEDKDKDKGDK